MNQHTFQRRPVSNSAIPDVIFVLLIINALAWAAQFWEPGMMISWFALWPIGAQVMVGSNVAEFMPWQLLTYGFLHDTQNLGHIFFNMFGLWMFGRDLERLMGPKRFLTYFLTCVIGAGLVQLIVSFGSGSVYPTIGASGGLFGILLAYAMAFPNRTVMLLIPPIPMKARTFVIVYGAAELFFGVSGIMPGVAHFAHLGGMLFGFLLLQHWRKGGRR